MKTYACQTCATQVYAENLICRCGTVLAYDPDTDQMVETISPCANRETIGCNWTAPEPGALCMSCAMTTVAPDTAVDGNTQLWARAEAAKRRVLIQLMGWGWLTADDTGPRPTFALLAEATRNGPDTPVMGHSDGHITLAIAESDPVEITRRREALNEPLRTMVGHVRHELGHFLFWRIQTDPSFIGPFRRLFGDERADYGAALATYHAQGADPDWMASHVTAYAAAHPHEDWAETMAHAMHLSGLVESAAAFGLGDGSVPDTSEALLNAGYRLSLALNHMNRSMGLDDTYPFVVPDRAHTKLVFALEHLRQVVRPVVAEMKRPTPKQGQSGRAATTRSGYR